MDGLDPALRRRVGAARVARLATVRPDATPHIVPITFALVGRSIVTAVDDKPKTTTALQRLRNIATNPAVSVLIETVTLGDVKGRTVAVLEEAAELWDADGQLVERLEAVRQASDMWGLVNALEADVP